MIIQRSTENVASHDLDAQVSSLRRPEEPGIEYKYITNVKALETLRNLLRREGITLPDGSNHMSFKSSKRLDMRGYKERGIIWSYSIIRVGTVEDVIEEG